MASDEKRNSIQLRQNERAVVERQVAERQEERPEAKRTSRRSDRSELFGVPQAPQPQAFQPPVEAAPATAATANLSVAPVPQVSDMLQGLMHQQQELYRHQQDALARLQEEADRLRQEKEVAKQDLLDMKARQLEDKEKDVKKLQRKLQRQMLLQGAPIDSILPSVASTPKDLSGMQMSPDFRDFYSKYETPVTPTAPARAVEPETSGYPSDEDFRQLRRESNDPSEWPVAPVPWLQPDEKTDISSSAQVTTCQTQCNDEFHAESQESQN